ncbi:hypothetical protein [Streptomyces sp. Ru62]|nr:hypothetical protein [Streptomyces sp. Ru62]
MCGAVAVLLLAVGLRDTAVVWWLRRHGVRTWGRDLTRVVQPQPQ